MDEHKIKVLKDKLDEAQEEAMRYVLDLNVARTDWNDWETDYKLLMEWLLTTTTNPWEFLSKGYECCLDTAQGLRNLLHTLHHAMCDDGDLCFQSCSESTRLPKMFFSDCHHMAETCSEATWGSSQVTFEYHQDVKRFIAEIESSKVAHLKRVAKIDAYLSNISEIKEVE